MKMRKPPESPPFNVKHIKISKRIEKELNYTTCSIGDIVKICNEKGLDLDRVLINFEECFGFHPTFVVLKDMDAEEHRNLWKEFYKKEKAYDKWAQKHKDMIEAEKIKEKMRKLEEELKKYDGKKNEKRKICNIDKQS